MVAMMATREKVMYMTIIKIEPYDNGAHANQTSSGVIPVPDGWAVVPEDLPVPDSFPFVDITVEDGVVTSMTAREVPEPEPEPTPEPTEAEQMRADIDFLMCVGGYV